MGNYLARFGGGSSKFCARVALPKLLRGGLTVQSRKFYSIPKGYDDPDYVRIRYVRYADNLLLGITGPKALVEHLRSRISTFMKSDLKLDIEQCAIVHAAGNRVKFLGVWLGVVPPNSRKWPRRHTREMEKRRRVRGILLERKKNLQEAWDRKIGWLARKAWARGVRKAARLLGSERKAVEAMRQKAAQLAAEFVLGRPEYSARAARSANSVNPANSGPHQFSLLASFAKKLNNTAPGPIPSTAEAAYNNLVLALETSIQQVAAPVRAILPTGCP